MTPDKVVDESEPVGGTVITMNLGHENEDTRRAALESAQKSAGPAAAASPTEDGRTVRLQATLGRHPIANGSPPWRLTERTGEVSS